MPGLNGKLQHPAVQWGLIVSVVAIGLTGFKMINAVENQVNANELQIGFEQTMRVIGQEQIEEDLDELKGELKEVKQIVEEGQDSIEAFLKEILKKQEPQ